MKRFFTLIMVLALILPAAVFADEIDFYAAYAHTEMLEKDHDAPFFSVIKFSEDHKCYYCEQMFYSDRPGTSNAMIGTWEMSGDRDILVTLGRSSMSFTLHLLDNGDLIHTETKQIYNRINAIWVSR